MRKLLKEIGDRVEAFIAQRDNVALMLRSDAANALPLLKILEGIEEQSRSDLFWTFTDAFTTEADYAEAIVKSFAAKHEAVRLALDKQNMPPWPRIPAPILSAKTPAAERIRRMSAFSRELLPVPNGGVNVWAFFPLEISSSGDYSAFVADVIRHEFPFPWCHHLRFIFRMEERWTTHGGALGQSPRVEWYEPDLSMESVNRSLEAEVADESLPLAERMAPLPIMAGDDFAWGRYPDALHKYELLLRYHAQAGNYAMAALALNGMGEIYERTGDLDRANDSFESALIPASRDDHPPVPLLLNIISNLADLRVRQMRWDEAEQYYDMAQQLATAARNPTAKISSLEKRGVCQQEIGKREEAAKSWNDGAVIAAQLEDLQSCRTLLGRLERHYTEINDVGKAQEIRAQLAVLSAPAGS